MHAVAMNVKTESVPAAFHVAGAQLSVPGVRPQNDDCIGMRLDQQSTGQGHGVAAAIADGVSRCAGGRHAAEICVQGFLSDFFATPDTWPVKRAGFRVIEALNRWLAGLSPNAHREQDKHLSTFSALVLSGHTAHLFHVGDTRIWRYRDGKLTQLTRDDRDEAGHGALDNAMGAHPRVAISYGVTDIAVGDLFLLTTDGIHDWLKAEAIADVLAMDDSLEARLQLLIAEAARHSNDNMSAQLLAVTSESETTSSVRVRKVPSGLRPGQMLDHYRIEKRIHESARSELFLAEDTASGQHCVLKIPSLLKADDPDHLEHFLREQWLLKQIRHPHIVRAVGSSESEWLYSVMAPVSGITLRQWLQEQRQLDIPKIVSLLTQLAQAIQYLHRQAVLHLDIKPENIIVDEQGHLTLIDLGSASHGNLNSHAAYAIHLLTGTTLAYSAPEVLSRQQFTPAADLYSLGIVAYEMLSGAPPKRKLHSKNGKPLRFDSLSEQNPYIPLWLDGAVRRACHPDPAQRHEAFSEFVHELHHPNAGYLQTTETPLLERAPEQFWKGVSLLLAAILMMLLYFR